MEYSFMKKYAWAMDVVMIASNLIYIADYQGADKVRLQLRRRNINIDLLTEILLCWVQEFIFINFQTILFSGQVLETLVKISFWLMIIYLGICRLLAYMYICYSKARKQLGCLGSGKFWFLRHLFSKYGWTSTICQTCGWVLGMHH